MLPLFLLLLLLLGLAAPATAVADLERVTIEVVTLRNAGAIASLRTRIELEGTQIVEATLTPPGGMPVAIMAGEEGFVLERPFMSEQELAAALPDGAYVLTVNGTRTYPFDFARAAVPSPAISAPAPASVLVPGPVTVEFSPCPACSGEDDTTQAAILDAGTNTVLFGEELGPEDESWTPNDGADPPMPIPMPEDSALRAIVEHVARRTEAGAGTGGDAFEFVSVVGHADAVPFFTGFAAPAGSLCLVVGEVADTPPDCIALDAPEAALVDPSGAFALALAGVAMEYGAEVGPGGEIAGAASADLDGDGSLETSVPVRGKLRGFRGKLERRVSFDFRSAEPAAKLAVRIREAGLVTEGPVSGSQRAKGKLLGAKVAEEAPSALPFGDGPIGWRFEVELAGKRVEEASVDLEDGRSFALRGRFLFDPLTDLGKLDLRSEGDDAGLWVRIEDFRFEEGAEQPSASGDLTFRILGQRGRILLP